MFNPVAPQNVPRPTNGASRWTPFGPLAPQKERPQKKEAKQSNGTDERALEAYRALTRASSNPLSSAFQRQDVRPGRGAVGGAAGMRGTVGGSNPYERDFVDAAEKVGVPEAWANDPSLLKLIANESSWDPTIKNPGRGNTAYGLFQMIESTWSSLRKKGEPTYGSEGHRDPYWQAVMGFRYIAAEYGTPKNAYDFWLVTNPKKAKRLIGRVKDPSELPSRRLRRKARQWLKDGLAGY